MIGIVIQARMGSSRCPGKTLAPLKGIPLLQWLIKQISNIEPIDKIIVATTDQVEDESIVRLCESLDVDVFRGSENDVLSRYYHCSVLHGLTTVIRITGDCVFITPDTITEVLQFYRENNYIYVSNTLTYTRPEGQDVEIFSFESLENAYLNATSILDREHVTPFMKRIPNGVYNYAHPESPTKYSRLSVDYLEDLIYAEALLERLLSCQEQPFTFEVLEKTLMNNHREEDNQVVNRGFYTSIYNEANGLKAKPLNLVKSEELLARSYKVIPGCAQTYSKSINHHISGVTPAFLAKGKGASVVDVDGNEYVDLIQGLLPNIFGYAHDQINTAVSKSCEQGHSFSLATQTEVLLAEKLIDLFPCAEKVRFGKNGSDATAAAIRVARAFTGRDRVAVCGYHGWQDWYIGSTSRDKGVPASVKELTSNFKYNDLESIRQLLSSHPGEFAAVILEPFNFYEPLPGYLSDLKSIVHQHGALLIFDETCSGFHFGPGGAQKIFGVTPDLATIGKALGNGWPISAVLGREDIMNLFEDVFFSFTFAGDTSAMTAALTVLDLLEKTDAYQRINTFGKTLIDACTVFAEMSGLQEKWRLQGRPAWLSFNFVQESGKPDELLRSLWIQEVTRRGVLILTTFNPTAIYTEKELFTILNAFAGAFKMVGSAVASKTDLASLLNGPIPTPAFKAR